MAKLITAHTNIDSSFPGYINFSRENDGTVTVYFRSNPNADSGQLREGVSGKLTLSAEAFVSIVDGISNAALQV